MIVVPPKRRVVPFPLLSNASLALFLAICCRQLLPVSWAASLCLGIVLAGALWGLGFLTTVFVRQVVLRRDQLGFLGILLTRLLMLGMLLVLKIGWVMWYAPEPSGVGRDFDILARRRYLIARVTDKDFGPQSMPFFVPQTFKQEWAIGTLSMTTAALTNLAFTYPETRMESLTVIKHLLERMLKQDLRDYEVAYWGEDALKTLAEDSGHIGYLGHLNLMLGAYRLLGGEGHFDELHTRITQALAKRLATHAFPYLETFPGGIFVPDNLPVYASLVFYDKIMGTDHSALVQRWQAYTEANLLDAQTGLLMPLLDWNGHPIGEVRGSYNAWNSFYLPHIAPDFATDQFEKLTQHMLTQLPFGALAVREYLSGRPGQGDIDSGPVIFGLSTAGTGFAIGGASHAQEALLRKGLLLTAEIGGATIEVKGQRFYLFSPLVGDAIMLAMRTACSWDERFIRE